MLLSIDSRNKVPNQSLYVHVIIISGAYILHFFIELCWCVLFNRATRSRASCQWSDVFQLIGYRFCGEVNNKPDTIAAAAMPLI